MVTLAENGFDAVLEDPHLREQAEGILREAFPEGTPLSMLRRGMETPSLARANAWRACIDFSAKDRLAEVRCPTLVVHGTADMLIPFRAGELVARAISGAKWLVEEGVGHSLPQERAESFTRALVDFLRQGP
jgi:pimeloyl-ACP methyl ester carboxylesterase